MQNEYRVSWSIPVSDHPRMVPDMAKAIEKVEKDREAGNPVVWGEGTETQAALMTFGIREVLNRALRVETGIADSGGRLSLELATMQYDFTRTALNGDGVQSAEVDFEIAAVSLDEAQNPAELRLNIISSIHRVMTDGERRLHVSANETLVIPLSSLDSSGS